MSAKAKCERTSKVVPLEEGYFVGNPHTGEWQFICSDAPEEGADYPIAVKELLRSPGAFVDWMGQIAEKTWMQPAKFMALFERIRDDNDLFRQ